MTITSVQGEATADNFSVISEEIASRLLRGWTMLESVCNICHETPLLKQRNAPDQYCARCNVFLKRESAEKLISSTPDQLDDATKEKSTVIENANENDTEKEKVKYIKEIKLQTGEFNDFLSKSAIPQFETNSFMNINKYINEKCGSYFTDYALRVKAEQHIKEKEKAEKDKEKEKEIVNKRKIDDIYVKEEEKTEEATEELQNEIETKIESVDTDFQIRPLYCEDKLVGNLGKLKNEDFVFAKVKYALMNVLEKYAEELIPYSNKNKEVELITKMTQVTTLLEKINNLSKTLTI